MKLDQHRTLTRSGLALSEIGLGCATLAFDAAVQAQSDARELLVQAQELGISYFDTAPFYGRGLSERLVGDAIRGNCAVVLSSKVGRQLSPDTNVETGMPFTVAFDYSYDGIMRSVEDSFQRLGLANIDILFAHDLGRHTHGDAAGVQFRSFFDGGGYRALESLRAAGDVKSIGLGVNEIAVCQQAMAHGEFDVFLLAGRHSLLERTEAMTFFGECARVGTDIVVGGPFNSGLLVGGATYNYGAVPEDISERHQALLAYCKGQGVDIGAAALQFPLRQPIVKSVIPGPKSLTELQQILHWAAVDIPNAFWAGLEELS